MNRLVKVCILPILAVIFSESAQAQTIALDPGQRLEDERKGWLPYVFSTDSMGTTVGAAAFSSIKRQPQSSLFGTAFASSNESFGIVGALSNLKIPKSRRLFFDSFVLLGHYTDSRYYVDLDKDPSQIRAGSNDSDADDFVTGINNNVQLELTLKYPLAIGGAADNPLSIYHLERGLLASGPKGGEHWNPLRSGKTTLSLQYFGRYQDLDESTQSELLFAKTNGFEFELDYDNTDFPRNPSRGSRQKLILTRDFGWFDSSNSWTNIELDLSKYIDLGTSGWFRQQSMAFNFWTSNSPTWNSDKDNPQSANNRPPPYMGSTLGGYDRLRAFPNGRFNDKSAVYYTAEMRLIPDTKPLRDIKLLNYFEIDWIQLAPFVEAGRVAPEYNHELFFDDLKIAAGIDLRLMAFRNVFRLGWAWSEEGNQIWAMFGQPFAR